MGGLIGVRAAPTAQAAPLSTAKRMARSRVAPIRGRIGSIPSPRRLAMLDDIGPDLDEARAKIEATRDALQAALDGQEDPDERLAALVARLDRMAAEVERVEDAVTAHPPWARRSLPRSKWSVLPSTKSGYRAHRRPYTTGRPCGRVLNGSPGVATDNAGPGTWTGGSGRSSISIWTPSTRPSSSATTPSCRGKPVAVGGCASGGGGGRQLRGPQVRRPLRHALGHRPAEMGGVRE